MNEPPDDTIVEPENSEFHDDELGEPSQGWLLRTVAIVAILGLVALFVIRPAPERTPPDFGLPLLDGSGTLVSGELKGRVVVLNFWASWCGPCREEAPHLERVWQTFRDEGVVVVGVNVQDQPEKALRFAEEEGLTFPLVTDYDQALARALGVFGLPQTFFIDRDWRFHGSSEEEPQATESPAFGTGFQGSDITVLGAISEEELVRNVREMLERGSSGGDG